MSNPQLSGLWAYDPKEAAKRVIHALEEEKSAGDTYQTNLISRTAARLKISRRTLFRWLSEKIELKGWS
jgi:hypothetical protein